MTLTLALTPTLTLTLTPSHPGLKGELKERPGELLDRPRLAVPRGLRPRANEAAERAAERLLGDAGLRLIGPFWRAVRWAKLVWLMRLSPLAPLHGPRSPPSRPRPP